MAITITGNGYSYTVPSSMGLKSFGSPSIVSGQTITGRDGIILNKKTISIAPQELTLSGLLKGTDIDNLASKFKTLSEVINSYPEPLVINTGARTIRVRKTHLSVDRIPSGGKSLNIAVSFISEDGYWQDNIPTETNLGSFSGYPKAVLKAVIVSGSYKTYPTILWKPAATIQDPVVTWHGKNIVKNSEFKNGTTTDWTVSVGTPRVEKYATKFVARVAYNHRYQQSIPCNPTIEYYFSAYAVSDTAATVQLNINWYTNANVWISQNDIYYVVSTILTRFSQSLAAPATAAYFQLVLTSTGNEVFVYITDIQVEESTTLSEYMPSQNVHFAIMGNTLFPATDVLEVDMEKRTVRQYITAQAVWNNKLDKSNAQFFHLIPGRNSLAFSNELNANAQVLVRYIEKYLGY